MRRTSAICALFVALSACQTAQAQVVPQRSIKGVHIGWYKSDVRAVLGAPDRIVRRKNEIVSETLTYDYGRTHVTFIDDVVFNVSTTSRRERTSAGVRVGSSRRFVQQHVRGARCLVQYGRNHCYVGTWMPGRIITEFLFGSTGRVKLISLGRVID